jgi:hypothetical protein
MKNIYIIQNSELSFDMDISKIYSPAKYSLFLITNKFGVEKLKSRNQNIYFNKVWETEKFSFDHLKEIISTSQTESGNQLQIVTNAEEAVIVCGNLRVFFNIDKSNYDRFNNKIVMKELINKASLLIPKHITFNVLSYRRNADSYLAKITTILSFPLIAKPIDSWGCIGIKKIESFEQLETWCEEVNTTETTYEIDEYIEGKVYNCDSYIKNDKIIFTQVSECSNSCYDFICGSTKGTIALPHDDAIYNLLREYTIKAHEAIGIPSGGVTHLEVILTKDMNIYFIEIGHRSPGILIPAMYKKFLNISTIESHILLQIDDDYKFDIKQDSYCAWIAFPNKNGGISSKYTPEINSDYNLEWYINLGNSMSSAKTGRDYAGRALLWNDDYQQLRKDFFYLNSFNFFDVTCDYLIK